MLYNGIYSGRYCGAKVVYDFMSNNGENIYEDLYYKMIKEYHNILPSTVREFTENADCNNAFLNFVKGDIKYIKDFAKAINKSYSTASYITNSIQRHLIHYIKSNVNFNFEEYTLEELKNPEDTLKMVFVAGLLMYRPKKKRRKRITRDMD